MEQTSQKVTDAFLKWGRAVGDTNLFDRKGGTVKRESEARAEFLATCDAEGIDPHDAIRANSWKPEKLLLQLDAGIAGER